jgi:uncharacterized protein YuzE
MGKEVRIWYDKERDYLEVIFEQKAGYFKETENDAVMEKVDEEGNVIGFSILKVSALKEQKPLSISLGNRGAVPGNCGSKYKFSVRDLG